MKKYLLALDIGNVCIKIDHRNCPEMLQLPSVPQTLFDLAIAYEHGRIRQEEEFISRALEILDHRFTPEFMKKAFNSILIEPVPGMAELVSELDSLNVEAVFFSDISPTHLKRTGELFPAFDKVSGGVFSFEAGDSKPSEAMFSRFELLYGTPSLYTDDRPELIEAARKRGWNAVQFTSAADLRKKLIALS